MSMKHPEHICRFNDEPQTCDCYDLGYIAGAKEYREKVADLLDDMWCLICNVNQGIIEDETQEWYIAFLRIRDKYFSHLDGDKSQEI